MALAASSQQVETDEPCHVVGTRAPSNFLRQALLYHPALFNDHEPIGEDSRINRIVRHQKCRPRKIAQVPTHLSAYQQMCFGVKRSQRLIQQKQPGLGGKCPSQRHSLSLPTRHRPWLDARQLSNAHPREPSRRPPPRLRPLQPPHQRAECDIVKNSEVREQQIVLKDHPYGSLVRGSMETRCCIGHDSPTDRDPPGRDPKQPGQRP